MPLGEMSEFKQATRQKKLSVVLTQNEIIRLFEHLKVKYKPVGGILYGSGLFRMKCVRLRVHDVDLFFDAVAYLGQQGLQASFHDPGFRAYFRYRATN